MEGISIQIWEETASRLDRPFVYVPQPNSKANIEAVGQGDVDLAIGPISITPDRLANPKIDFTQPYFHGEEGLMIPMRPPSLWSRFSPFFGWAALSSLGGLMVLLFVVGNLIWLAERRRNSEHFPRPYFKGVGNGMWFALVTLTTVGYGDRAPTLQNRQNDCRRLDVDVVAGSVIHHCWIGVCLHCFALETGAINHSRAIGSAR